MTQAYTNDSDGIGFEDGEAWFRLDRVSFTEFAADASMGPRLTTGSLRELRDWIDARLKEVESA